MLLIFIVFINIIYLQLSRYITIDNNFVDKIIFIIVNIYNF